jgi:hypothetical protein
MDQCYMDVVVKMLANLHNMHGLGGSSRSLGGSGLGLGGSLGGGSGSSLGSTLGSSLGGSLGGRDGSMGGLGGSLGGGSGSTLGSVDSTLCSATARSSGGTGARGGTSTRTMSHGDDLGVYVIA